MSAEEMTVKLVSLNWYRRDDVVALAKEVLGKRLKTTFQGETKSGIIMESEAYAGVTDRASHAFGGRRTKRTEPMFAAGGIAYVYLCYGIHHLFNIVTNIQDVPHAILIRAIEMEGRQIIGPGNVTKALGIRTEHTGHCLRTSAIILEETGVTFHERDILASERVGVDYAGEDARLPWRFRVKHSQDSL